MKTFIISSVIVFFGWFHLNDTPSSYESKLSNIASDFREKIMEKDDCKNLMYDASRVADDIDDELKKEDYSASEISQFKEVKRKAEALESYIGSVGGCSNTFPTVEEFNLANRIVGGSVSNLVQAKFCVDFISVSIDKYKVYLGENNSNSNYTVSYSWKAPDGLNSGKGTMGLSAKNIRHIYDNREKPNQKKISIFGVTCKPF